MSCPTCFRIPDVTRTQTATEILPDLLVELYKADQKHGPMQECIEGLYTLRCEVEELTREVHRKNKDLPQLRKEAVQVGAMALKFLRDCCQE